MIPYLITGIFSLAILVVAGLKWQNPNLDATFLSVLIGMVMSMAGFLSLHFKQQKMESKIEQKMENTATTVKETASDLKEQNSQIIKNQTEEIIKAVGEIKNPPA